MKSAKLDSETLYEMGDAMKVQNFQLNSVEIVQNKIEDGIEKLETMNEKNAFLLEELDNLLSEDLEEFDDKELDLIIDCLHEDDQLNRSISNEYTSLKTVKTGNNWKTYVEMYSEYADNFSIEMEKDPFLTSLSQREYEELYKEINDNFSKKTSIKNKTDLSFLAIATALQVTKTVLFSIIAQKKGYGGGFDKNERLNHNDKSIVDAEKKLRSEYRDKKLSEGNDKGEWMEILYRTPPYDITRGSKEIGFQMEGKYHRIHTLGHDPILGWIFGTANILTDTITFDTFATHKVMRNPMIITKEQISIVSLFSETLQKIKEGHLNLPAALMAEKIHLKSDEFTKCGLPIPILETFTPELAGNLYKNQYDALCFSRDLKLVGESTMLSLLIDMIIGLVHAMYYDKHKDGTKDLFEIRTRKILLISNTIASTSNLVYTTITQNPRNLDIGGLMVTIAHLFSDTKFMLKIKREFIEKRIYEKVESEIKNIDESRNKLFEYEYKYKINLNYSRDSI